jgi:Ca-activated chloride channel family protein
MTKSLPKYRNSTLAMFIIGWELVFFAILAVVMSIFGYFSHTGSNHLAFKHEYLLLFLFLLPILGLVQLWKRKQFAKTTAKLGVASKSLIYQESVLKTFIKYFFIRNTLGFLILAMAGPVYGSKKVKATKETLELVICLDISNSMNAKDISKENSRLDVSKRALIQLINNLNGEQIGLVLFANSAFVQLPLTSDYPAGKLFIKDVETSMISNQGTSIGEALNVATNMFSEKKVAKGIILVTDGEDHEAGLENKLESMRKKSIELSVLGIGTREGGLVPKDPQRPEIGYKTDALGKTVLSKLNRELIKDIAQKSGGFAHFSDDEFPDLSPLLTELKTMKRSKIDTLDFDVQQDRYRLPLVFALMMLLGYLIIRSEILNRQKI